MIKMGKNGEISLDVQNLEKISKTHHESQKFKEYGGITQTWIIGILILNLSIAVLIGFWYVQNQNGNTEAILNNTNIETTTITSNIFRLHSVDSFRTHSVL